MEGREEIASLEGRIFRSLAIISVAVVLAVGLVAAVFIRQTAATDASTELGREVSVVASALAATDDEVAELKAMGISDVRITLVAADGTVLYDSKTDASQMMNHADRPEIASARESGEGASERMSATAGYVSIYHARRLPSGDVVRLSVDRAGIMATFVSYLPPLIAIAALLIAGSFFVARYASRRLVRPILELDLDAPQASTPYRELAPLTRRLDDQRMEISEQMDKLKDSEKMRREFTSNVTHELKTPLASISGAAELIRDGIARPEDIPDFAGRICDETARLTDLVNDILTLSKLDEAERSSDRDLLGSVERVDILAASRDVCDRLSSQARSSDVKLSVSGSPSVVTGQARLLDELVYNLVDNAIRYNRRGGTVAVVVGRSAGKPTLSVADTGLGIPKDKLDKVFERFYRVDTSRSRESGGTGLGLAIVKHAATINGATLDIESELGKGTTITVTFPATVSGVGDEESV